LHEHNGKKLRYKAEEPRFLSPNSVTLHNRTPALSHARTSTETAKRRTILCSGLPRDLGSYLSKRLNTSLKLNPALTGAASNENRFSCLQAFLIVSEQYIASPSSIARSSELIEWHPFCLLQESSCHPCAARSKLWRDPRKGQL